LLEFGELALGGRAAHAGELLQEIDDLRRIARHLGGQRVLREVREAHQVRRFVAQREDLGHQRPVVPLSRMRSAVGGARDPGLVESAAQGFVDRVGQHRLVGRRIERKQPSRRSRCLGGGAGAMHRIGGQAVELAFVDDVPRPRVGRVEHVLVELRLRGGEPLHDFAEALLAVVRQRDAGETEIA
jgi:hypothetical protein